MGAMFFPRDRPPKELVFWSTASEIHPLRNVMGFGLVSCSERDFQ